MKTSELYIKSVSIVDPLNGKTPTTIKEGEIILKEGENATEVIDLEESIPCNVIYFNEKGNNLPINLLFYKFVVEAASKQFDSLLEVVDFIKKNPGLWIYQIIKRKNLSETITEKFMIRFFSYHDNVMNRNFLICFDDETWELQQYVKNLMDLIHKPFIEKEDQIFLKEQILNKISVKSCEALSKVLKIEE